MINEQKLINSICKKCYENKNCFFKFFAMELECKKIKEKLRECDEYIVTKTSKLFEKVEV